MGTTVLICDDNIAVHESLGSYLKEEKIHVISAYNGEDALRCLNQMPIDFLILDLMLPGRSGIEILKEVRRTSDIPILILSAKTSEFDRILGLELGADDYIAKPFSPREIATRIQVILRRIQNTVPKMRLLSCGNLVINPDSYKASINGDFLDLTPKELKVLALLTAKAGTVLSRDYILDNVWGYESDSDIRSVDTQIKRLRQKLPEDATFQIVSVYGVGYKIEEVL